MICFLSSTDADVNVCDDGTRSWSVMEVMLLVFEVDGHLQDQFTLHPTISLYRLKL